MTILDFLSDSIKVLNEIDGVIANIFIVLFIILMLSWIALPFAIWGIKSIIKKKFNELISMHQNEFLKLNHALKLDDAMEEINKTGGIEQCK